VAGVHHSEGWERRGIANCPCLPHSRTTLLARSHPGYPVRCLRRVPTLSEELSGLGIEDPGLPRTEPIKGADSLPWLAGQEAFRWLFVGGLPHKNGPQFGGHRITAGQSHFLWSGRRDSNPRPPPWQLHGGRSWRSCHPSHQTAGVDSISLVIWVVLPKAVLVIAAGPRAGTSWQTMSFGPVPVSWYARVNSPFLT
jgi:hypothetical protein